METGLKAGQEEKARSKRAKLANHDDALAPGPKGRGYTRLWRSKARERAYEGFQVTLPGPRAAKDRGQEGRAGQNS
jgi:hypothetical protein